MSGLTHGASWSDADVDRLAKLYFSQPKPSVDAMAETLGRTRGAVWTVISRLGMAAPGAKMRTCMPCDKPFYSSWIGERICSYCKSSELLRCA